MRPNRSIPPRVSGPELSNYCCAPRRALPSHPDAPFPPAHPSTRHDIESGCPAVGDPDQVTKILSTQTMHPHFLFKKKKHFLQCPDLVAESLLPRLTEFSNSACQLCFNYLQDLKTPQVEEAHPSHSQKNVHKKGLSKTRLLGETPPSLNVEMSQQGLPRVFMEHFRDFSIEVMLLLLLPER